MWPRRCRTNRRPHRTQLAWIVTGARVSLTAPHPAVLRTRAPWLATLPPSRDTEQAMSRENVEVIGRFYECLTRRDWDAMWRDLDPDFVLDTELQGSYRGRDECQAFARTRSVRSSLRRRSPWRCSRAASTSRSS